VKHSWIYYGLVFLAVIGLATLRTCREKADMKNAGLYAHFTSLDDFAAFFPHTPAELHERVEHYMVQAREMINAIVAVPDDQRTFENTAMAFDRLVTQSNIARMQSVVYLLETVHPDDALRGAAHEALSRISAFIVDNISGNVALCQALKAYADGNAQQEELNDEQRYFLQETLNDFKRSGLDLPEKERAKVRALKKELADLTSAYSLNMSQDTSSITVEQGGLKGLPEAFINALSQDDQGNYILGVDYPTYDAVMQECSIEDTRERLYLAFMNRAYPVNVSVLNDIIATRDALATALGFETFAAYDIANQMAKSPDVVEPFVQNLIKRAYGKEDKEFALLREDLPESVSLTKDGKFKPWDIRFAQTKYKKKHMSIDEQEIAEYFPLEKTLNEIFGVYGQFLGLTFESVSSSALWHNEVRSYAMRSADDNTLLGYVVLDLFPRANKYPHAGHIGMIESFIKSGERDPGVSVIVANFSRPRGDRPALLKRGEVQTFFHEFGHAMHSLLSANKIASIAGINGVKRDFVEVPSQMFEEWFWDPDILKRVSGHYQTGQSLPVELIERIVASKRADVGFQVGRQGCFSLYSLKLFSGTHDPDVLLRSLYAECKRHERPSPDDHMYAAFTHLSGYASKYYSYAWSEVIALDLFAEIKRQGFLDPTVGKRLTTTLLGRGASNDPAVFVRDFLGRDADQEAFFELKGLV